MNRNYQPQTKQANIKRFTRKFSCYSHNLKQVNVDVILHDEENQSNLALAVLSKRTRKSRDIKPVQAILVQMGISETVINFFQLVMRKVLELSPSSSDTVCVPQTFTLCFRCNTARSSQLQKFNNSPLTLQPPHDIFTLFCHCCIFKSFLGGAIKVMFYVPSILI